jgi:hypothetical protein
LIVKRHLRESVDLESKSHWNPALLQAACLSPFGPAFGCSKLFQAILSREWQVFIHDPELKVSGRQPRLMWSALLH